MFEISEVRNCIGVTYQFVSLVIRHAFYLQGGRVHRATVSFLAASTFLLITTQVPTRNHFYRYQSNIFFFSTSTSQISQYYFLQKLKNSLGRNLRWSRQKVCLFVATKVVDIT